MQPNMKVEADIEECEFELLGSAGDPAAESECARIFFYLYHIQSYFQKT